jgi:hypothetical protein
MRLIEIPVYNYDALIHDLIKNTTVLLTIEYLQNKFLGDPLLDGVFISILMFTIVGNIIFYLIVDQYLVGAGPVMSGNKVKETIR